MRDVSMGQRHSRQSVGIKAPRVLRRTYRGMLGGGCRRDFVQLVALTFRRLVLCRRWLRVVTTKRRATTRRCTFRHFTTATDVILVVETFHVTQLCVRVTSRSVRAWQNRRKLVDPRKRVRDRRLRRKGGRRIPVGREWTRTELPDYGRVQRVRWLTVQTSSITWSVVSESHAADRGPWTHTASDHRHRHCHRRLVSSIKRFQRPQLRVATSCSMSSALTLWWRRFHRCVNWFCNRLDSFVTGHFSGSCRAIDPVCVYLCVCRR